MNKKAVIAKLKFVNQHVLPPVAIVIAGLALLRECGQDSNSQKIRYELNALSLQPRLKIAGETYMPAMTADSLEVRYSGQSMTSVGKTPFVDMTVQLTLEYDLGITNIGNSLAKMEAIFSVDSSSASDVIRDLLFTTRLDSMNLFAFDDYSTIELLPNASDTIHMKISRPLRDWPGQEFTVHILLLYENELHQYFDTYYWLRYRFGDVLLPIPEEGRRGAVAVGDILTRSLTVLQQKQSFNTYDEAKVEMINKRLKTIQRTFEKERTSTEQR